MDEDPGARLKLTDASLYELGIAMKPAQGRPNELARIAGHMAYLRQDYSEAITQFKRGAHYADKYSQHVLSLMHWHGIGIDSIRYRATSGPTLQRSAVAT